jgi:hypothetical protein
VRPAVIVGVLVLVLVISLNLYAPFVLLALPFSIRYNSPRGYS